MHRTNVLESVRIIDYAPEWAQAIADMWNRSRDSWGGDSTVESADNVARDLENAGNLRVFLAVDGEEVVGFCSFSHYRHDEGALYVPLLNVRPDYHGRKIGRALILKAVETTVELGWPRLDLFTWAGNTKAVPMYKKCGFFWEKKDDSVHLMNFIPSVLQTEALKPYLAQFDWYADSCRSLDIAPDGRSENGFDYFEYRWQREGASLRLEYEKTGRGLRLIDTDDYSIHTEIEGHGLVFGRRYPVRYVIRNKSGKPLECTSRGRDDKNIRFELERTVQVQDEVAVEGEFALDPVLEEQNEWKTHPAVTSEWTINGKKAEFRTGIAPKFPAKVKLETKGEEQFLGAEEEAFLTFENNYKVPAAFEFTLPSSGFVEFGLSRVSVRVPALGRATVRLPYTLRDFGLYSEEVEMKALPEGGEPLDFVRRLHGLFQGNSGRFGGDAVDHWIAVNGPYKIGLNKTSNTVWASRLMHGMHTEWTFPKLGKPYSLEFSKKKAETVEVYEDGDAMALKAVYRSEDFPGYTVTVLARLHANGIVRHECEVANESGERGRDELHLIAGFYHDSRGLVLPYDGSYFDLEELHAANFDEWDVGRISENWLFSRSKRLCCGFSWHPDAKLVQSEWHLGIEHSLRRLAAGESFRTEPTELAIGTFTDWWDFRSYAQKRREPVRPLLKDDVELQAASGHPFVLPDARLAVRQHRNQPLDGELTLSSPDGAFERVQASFRQEDDIRTAEFPIGPLKPGAIVPVRMQLETTSHRLERRTAIIPLSGEPVRSEREADGELYRCTNGVLTIAASPAFGAGLHSLVYEGEEWLDSSYPQPGPRSWWNPWHGGISAAVQGLSALSQQEEERSAEFVVLTDNLGNEWRGIGLHTRVQKHEKNRGIEFSLFALLLPGAPVLCCVTRLTNRSGLSFHRFRSTIQSFFRPGPTLDAGWIETSGDTRYRSGKSPCDAPAEGVIRFGSDSRQAVLHAVNRHPGSDAGFYTNNLLVKHECAERLPLADGITAWASPVFFAFAHTPLTYKELRGLADIRFANP